MLKSMYNPRVMLVFNTKKAYTLDKIRKIVKTLNEETTVGLFSFINIPGKNFIKFKLAHFKKLMLLLYKNFKLYDIARVKYDFPP